MKKLRPIMFVGTGSDVGKSVINTAFCRIFLQDGLKPAPFKAQNMSLNSYATPDGLEIGRAQAVQAEACGIGCSVEMNPILLKPNSYLNSQIVLHGKPIGNKSAMEYFVGTDRDMLFDEAMKAYSKLDAQFNPIVIEGAGSISEVNLWDKDITNMRVAEKVNAATYLIADIDKGGVFASVYGTIQLLPESQRNLIKGIIINKFRGDIQLFTEGRKILEDLTGKPVVGVIPHFRDIFVEQEDSVVLDSATTTSKKGLVNVAVVLLKHMSNFTDFNLLEQHPNVHLYYTANPKELEQADIIIIPGSKNTIADLMHIRENNLAKVIINHHHSGKPVYGICGGYQIMGKELHDPYGIEGDTQFIPGLGILPTVTTISTEKKTVQCNFKFLDLPDDCTGYEIHMGQTVSEKFSPLCIISGNEPDGYFLNPSTWGTYIHGIFDNGAVVENILGLVGVKAVEKLDFRQYKDENYNKLANLVRENIDLEYIYSTLQND